MFFALGLSACTVVPGMHMSEYSDESSVDMPTQENNAAILKKLNIQTITAELIIDLEKNYNNRSLGLDNVSNHYFGGNRQACTKRFCTAGNRFCSDADSPDQYSGY